MKPVVNHFETLFWNLLQELRKPTKNLNQESWSPGQRLEPGASQIESTSANAEVWVRENVSVVNKAGRSTLTANMAQRVLSRSSGNKESVGVNHLNRSRILQPGTRLYCPHKLQGGEGIKYDFQRGAFPTSKPHNDAHFVDKESWQRREVLTNHDRSFYTWTVSGGRGSFFKLQDISSQNAFPTQEIVSYERVI